MSMPTMSGILLKRIAADLAANPLMDGEFRHIQKMGAHYVSREPARGDLRHLFQINVSGATYYIFYSTVPLDRTGL